MWIARSISTGHVAHGRTQEAATEQKLSLLRATIRLAVEQHRQTVEAWWDSQQRHASRYAVGFYDSAARGKFDELPDSTIVGGSRLIACRAVVQSN